MDGLNQELYGLWLQTIKTATIEDLISSITDVIEKLKQTNLTVSKSALIADFSLERDISVFHVMEVLYFHYLAQSLREANTVNRVSIDAVKHCILMAVELSEYINYTIRPIDLITALDRCNDHIKLSDAYCLIKKILCNSKKDQFELQKTIR